MSHKVVSLLLISLLLVTACGNNMATPTNAVAISPKDCNMLINQQMPLTLDGIISPNAVINWQADGGSVSFAPPGLNALFTAPPQPAVVTISAMISSGTPSVQIPITRQCIVLGNENTAGPTNTDSAQNLQVSQVIPNVSSALPTIIISEVMANPCGGIEFKKWNEYVELYNFGDQPVDVSGWWFTDNGGAGSPDQIVSWTQRNPTKPLAGKVILNSTIIPARGYALILSPSYADGEFPYAQPYAIPANTVILTAAESRSLGDDAASIVGDGDGRDVLVLYRGGASVIQEAVSTYGTPKPAQYVSDVKDNYLDNMPLDLHECSSIERVIATGADSEENWREVPYGSPGEAPY